MKKLLNIVLLHFVIVSVVLAHVNIEQMVNRFEKWYDQRSHDALNYQFPTDARIHEAEDKVPQDYGEYDFIVVGGGTTGSVVANRLSENPHWNVLLLEAGGYRDEEHTRVPGLSLLNTFTKFNWGFVTTPQETAFLGNPNRTSFYPRGKGLGGSSLINTIAYTRGNKQDYDIWADLVKDSGWNYENLLPLFKKSENFRRMNPRVPIDAEYHGYNGPLQISQAAPPLDFAHTILHAATQLGYNITDYNGKNQLGASIFQYFMKDGLRFDHEMAFLAPVKYRRNLRILDGSYVTKIEIDANKKAKGVIFTRKNKTFIARNRKEVILSAGAICSPQILMLSGIGPQDHLTSLEIPVIQDLPVGKTMYDHTMTVLTFTSNVTFETPTFRESIRQLLYGQGPLTRVLATDAVGFFKTPVEEIEGYPDVEFFFANFTNYGIVPKWFGFSQETADALAQNSSISFSISPYILHQKSFGTVTLKSTDPFDYPVINPNILSDKDNKDLETFYQAVQIVLKLLETETFRSMNVKLAVRQLPGCEHTKSMSREYWYCYVRRVSALLYHASSTCLTGTSPKTAVVDHQLKVFGIKSLRVADASVIPFAVSGHTNAPCTVVGEKASEIIKQNYNFRN